MLLCPSDHRAIDKKLAQKDWTVENLQQLKRRHEDRVHYLTGLGEDAETVVIRAIGAIRSANVSAEPEAVRRAVLGRQRYPRYELGVRSGSDIEVDFRGLPSEGDATYWETAREMLASTGAQLADGIRRGHVRHVSVFGFARIPLLVMLGDQLDDKVPTDLYEHHRDDLRWRWADDERPVSFRFDRVSGNAGADTVTLACSVSGSVALDQLPAEPTAGAVYELRPADADPVTDLIRVPETLAAFRRRTERSSPLSRPSTRTRRRFMSWARSRSRPRSSSAGDARATCTRRCAYGTGIATASTCSRWRWAHETHGLLEAMSQRSR